MLDKTKKINWFPGHMKKTTDEISILIKKVDLVVEVVDARAINISSNPDLEKFTNNKPILKIALKQDLSNSKIFYSKNLIISNINDKNLKNQIVNSFNNLLEEKFIKYQKNGLLNPKFLILVIGLPNVGKSSIINLLKGSKKLEVHNYPGVTKQLKIIDIHKNFYLVDTPGIFIKNIENYQHAYILSLLNNIKKEVVNLEDVVRFGLDTINKIDCNAIKIFYKLNDEYDNFYDFIKQLKPKYLLSNNELNENKLYNDLFNDISKGKILKFNYE